uniref:AAA family ATPase n=1 Tax=Kribbia dieselivorans TaxID=331526 RepID=UPI0008385D9A
MKRIALGFADRAMATELSAILAEIEQVEVVGVLTSSAELVDHCLRQETDIVLIHDGLGPDSATSVIRDLSFRRPGMASLIVSSTGETQTVVDTMEAGGRGVLTYPFVFEQILSRIANASAWVDQMGAVLAGRAAGAGVRRGKVVAFAGAKGGVGATTFAAHLAVDLHQEWPTAKTILVDLDLEKGDVSAMLDVRHTVSIADVAKIAGDMTIDRIQDATVVHDSGLTMLLAPQDVREVDFISPEALRSVFNHLRREYDVIIVDAGAHATPAQATVVELADEVIAVVTADVLCLRSLHRLTTAWESLGVRKEHDVRVLVNKVDKSDLFPSSAVPKLTRAPVFTTEVPQMARYLEPAVTNRDPRAVTEKQWWTLIREIGRQVTTGPDAPLPAAAAG